jgi:hypothetical protein
VEELQDEELIERVPQHVPTSRILHEATAFPPEHPLVQQVRGRQTWMIMVLDYYQLSLS